MDLAALRRGAAPVTVELDGETLALTYDPRRYTEHDEAALHELRGRLDPVVVPILARILVGWDLTDEGVPVPPTAASLTAIPPALRAAIADAIVRDSLDEASYRRLREVLELGGGQMPDWAQVIIESRWLGVPPWDLAGIPHDASTGWHWRRWITRARNAEVLADEVKAMRSRSQKR